MTRPIGTSSAGIGWAGAGLHVPAAAAASRAERAMPLGPLGPGAWGASDGALQTLSLEVSHPAAAGHLTALGQVLCRGLMRVDAGQGLVGFPLDKAPARGLAACVEPGQAALVLRNGQALGLSVDAVPLEDLHGLLLARLGEFSALSPERPEWALGLDIGTLSGADRGRLTALSRDFRLGIQDLVQGVWVVDRLGGLHADWPAGVRFEPAPA